MGSRVSRSTSLTSISGVRMFQRYFCICVLPRSVISAKVKLALR